MVAGGGREDVLFPNWKTSSRASGRTPQKDCDVTLAVPAFLSSLSHHHSLGIQQMLTYAGTTPYVWFSLKLTLALVSTCTIKKFSFCVITLPISMVILGSLECFSWFVMILTHLLMTVIGPGIESAINRNPEQPRECLVSDGVENFHQDIKRNSAVSFMSEIS